MFEFTLHTIITLFIIYYTNTSESTSERSEHNQASISFKYQHENHLPQVHAKFKKGHNFNPLFLWLLFSLQCWSSYFRLLFFPPHELSVCPIFFFLKYSLFGFYKSNGISDSKTQTPPIYNSKLETFSFKQFAIVALKLLSPIPNIRKISHGWIFEVFFSSQNHHNVRSHSLELSLLGSFFSFMNHVSCSGCIKWRKDIVEKKNRAHENTIGWEK